MLLFVLPLCWIKGSVVKQSQYGSGISSWSHSIFFCCCNLGSQLYPISEMAYDLFWGRLWDLLSYICRPNNNNNNRKTIPGFSEEKREILIQAPCPSWFALIFTHNPLYGFCASCCEGVQPSRGVQPAGTASLGNKGRNGASWIHSFNICKVQSNTGFTKPFPSKYIIIHHKVTGEEIR